MKSQLFLRQRGPGVRIIAGCILALLRRVWTLRIYGRRRRDIRDRWRTISLRCCHDPIGDCNSTKDQEASNHYAGSAPYLNSACQKQHTSTGHGDRGQHGRRRAQQQALDPVQCIDYHGRARRFHGQTFGLRLRARNRQLHPVRLSFHDFHPWTHSGANSAAVDEPLSN